MKYSLMFLLCKDVLQLTVRKIGKWTAIELNGASASSNFKHPCIQVVRKDLLKALC